MKQEIVQINRYSSVGSIKRRMSNEQIQFCRINKKGECQMSRYSYVGLMKQEIVQINRYSYVGSIKGECQMSRDSSVG